MKFTWNKKTVFAIAGVLLFIVIGCLLPAPAQLAAQAQLLGRTGRTAMITIGALAWAICWWVGMVIPDWCTALLLQCIWILAAGLEFTTAFSAFSKTTVWLIIGTFALSGAITKTGLLQRISLYLMRLFPSSYRGQVIAMMTVGTVCSPLMPSTTAKVVLGSKLACSSADIMGHGADSRGRSGLFVASWTGFGLMGPVFLSASFLSYSLLGSLPAQYADISWLQWLAAMLPWGIVVLIGMYLVVMLLYRPEHQGAVPRETIREQSAAMGKMGRSEIITACILGLCLIFWILEKTTGISSGIVALIGGVLCFAFGILDKKEITTCVPWGFVLFVGVVLNMGDIFAKTGISDWLLSIVHPLLSRVHSIYRIVILVFVLSTAMRFVLASQTAVITLLTSILSPIALALNTHPLVTALVVYSTISCWVALYQNPTYLAALEGMDGSIRHRDTVRAATCFLFVSLIGCLVSVPFWKLLGYIS